MTWSYPRSQAVDYSFSYWPSSLGVAIRTSEDNSSYFLTPFTFTLWVCILLLPLGVAIIQQCHLAVIPGNYTNYRETLMVTIFHMYGHLFYQGKYTQ